MLREAGPDQAQHEAQRLPIVMIELSDGRRLQLGSWAPTTGHTLQLGSQVTMDQTGGMKSFVFLKGSFLGTDNWPQNELRHL